ncbi:hypothetical protein ICJ04_16920 [Stenotrophomonas sp. 169]|uniref:hypothetical protein n=1 Tax=Stenotrophomonas sp. 169 TaxID=2770322 RepID=UPI001662827C|nr:hypothetical protein [Stenotrophomonas sp. 169]QNR97137.1 hypothetical protein ICJ04_16920 [Stenotrophomonas sp. 169]
MRGFVSSGQCDNSFFFFVAALLLVLVALLLSLLLLLLLVAAAALLALLILLVLLTLLRVLLILLVCHVGAPKPHAECRGHGHPLQALVNHAWERVEDGITRIALLPPRLSGTSTLRIQTVFACGHSGQLFSLFIGQCRVGMALVVMRLPLRSPSVARRYRFRSHGAWPCRSHRPFIAPVEPTSVGFA